MKSKLNFKLQMKQSCVSNRRKAIKSVVFVSCGKFLSKKLISVWELIF